MNLLLTTALCLFPKTKAGILVTRDYDRYQTKFFWSLV